MKPWHIIVLLVVVLLLFGAPKLPVFARNLGKSLNILKEETENLRTDAKGNTEAPVDEANDGGAKPTKEARDD